MTAVLWRLAKVVLGRVAARHLVVRRVLFVVSALTWMLNKRRSSKVVRLRPDETMVVDIVKSPGSGR